MKRYRRYVVVVVACNDDVSFRFINYSVRPWGELQCLLFCFGYGKYVMGTGESAFKAKYEV